jgi:hypothetical protein
MNDWKNYKETLKQYYLKNKQEKKYKCCNTHFPAINYKALIT